MTSESREGPLNKEEGEELRVVCLQCSTTTFHRIVRSAEYVERYEEHQFSMTSWDEFQIIECLGCRTHSFRQRHRDTENTDHDPDTGDEYLEERVELFPKRETGRAEIEETHLLPIAIQRVYSETLTALRNAMPVLGGIGIRAIVESVCKEKNTAGSNLEQRVDGLVTLGILTKDGAEVLHSLRIMGNQAAHEVRPHGMNDLNAAMDVIDYVLTGVYVLPHKAAKLPQRSAV